ncbi:response regulator [Pedosphaera parvula]|uniref:Response regulator receiver protein n=1 Tax=Pedosphaera parvula (strain Ellin514) TaxID=320771 RepID=B9XED4_PEDPL|nr:response regulator [Pedosphaera parvula]EEF61648.1 response regulator receiver protein [Pedosphaera parvula Ellin514]
MKTILSVDDGEDDAYLLHRALQYVQTKCNLESVPSAAAAMEYLSGTGPFADRYEHPLPSIILLDIKMPDTNGFELLRWIRSKPEFKSIPVIMLTCSEAAVDIEHAYEIGANSYLVKSLDFQNLKQDLPLFMHYWLDLNQTPESDQ